MTSKIMTQKPDSNEVQLSIRDLLAIASAVFAIIGSSWTFTLKVQSSIDVIGERMEHLNWRIQTLERERDRAPWLRGSPVSTDGPSPQGRLNP